MKLRIAKMVYGGAGLGYPADEEAPRASMLLPFTLPGEIVEARVTEKATEAREGSLLHILNSSPSRVQPKCAHFGECGGCHYQHASYSAQVEIKATILCETLERAGLSALPKIEVHTSAPWEYRNRSRLRLKPIDGFLSAGYNRRGSNEFLPVHECPISSPLIWRACEALLRVAVEPTPAGRWVKDAAEVEFFLDAGERKLQMTIFVTKDQAGLSAFCVRMNELVPELTGAGSALLPASSAPRHPHKSGSLGEWGAAGMSYRVDGEEYWVSRGSFFQVNRFLLDELLGIVTSGRSGAVAWDLYAGVGLFSRALARSFAHVTAVEAASPDLLNTFRGPGCRALRATTLDFLRAAVLQRERPELIVLDPPRAGAGRDVCTLLARIAAPEMVYISCDPITLARDLKILIADGYKVAELHLIDLFPQTFHLETIVVLRK